MKKVLLVSNKDNNFYNFRSELILKLKELNYEVVLVCPYGRKIDYFTEKGCKFIDINVDRRGKNVFKDLKLIKEYKKILMQERPDIVLTFTTKSSIYGGYAASKLKIPYIVNNAGLMEAKGLFKVFMNFLYKKGFKRASYIMFQNSYEQDYIEKLLKNKVPFKRIPGSGVNLDSFKYTDYPPDDQPITFNFVARIAQFKGIEEFLECAKRIKENHKNTRFVIYGDFDEDKYRILIEELSKQGVVEYGGVQIDMKPYIANAHAVIHPSHYEGMTNVVLEHSAMGRVCIGSDIPGVADGIDDGKTGFVFSKGNVESLVMAVGHFLKLPYTEKKQMGINAREKMEKEFSREIVTNAYIKEIERILKR